MKLLLMAAGIVAGALLRSAWAHEGYEPAAGAQRDRDTEGSDHQMGISGLGGAGDPVREYRNLVPR